MADDPIPGLFIAIEAADGSGKTAIVDHLVPRLASTGRAVHRIDRSRPAAAVQYRSILHAQVAPAVTAGDIVVAESWWDKTWIRLGVEAANHHGHTIEQRHAFAAWQRSLLPPSVVPERRRLTVLVNTARHDRVAWYRAADCPDPYLDPTGTLSRDPDGFGHFTEHIATRLREIAAEQNWPTVTNHADRPPAEAAADIQRPITDRLTQAT